MRYNKINDIFYIYDKSYCHDFVVSEITSPYRKEFNDFIYIIATPSKGGRLSSKKINNMIKLFNDYLSASGNENVISFEVNPSKSKLLVALNKEKLHGPKSILYVLLKCMRFFWCDEKHWKSAVEDYFINRASSEDSKWIKPNLDDINAVLDFMDTCFETKKESLNDGFLYSILNKQLTKCN